MTWQLFSSVERARNVGSSIRGSSSLWGCFLIKVKPGVSFSFVFRWIWPLLQSHIQLCGLFLHAASCSHTVVTLVLGNSKHITQGCATMLHNRSPKAPWPITRSTYTDVHGSGSQLRLIWSALRLVWEALFLVQAEFGSAPPVFILGLSSRNSGEAFFFFHCNVFGTKGHAQPPLLKPHPLTFHCPKQGTWTSPTPLEQECTLVTIQVGGANICFAIIQIITSRSSPKWWSIMAKELQMQGPWFLPSLPWCPHVAKSGRVGMFLPESFTLTP